MEERLESHRARYWSGEGASSGGSSEVDVPRSPMEQRGMLDEGAGVGGTDYSAPVEGGATPVPDAPAAADPPEEPPANAA